jgi:hypothetical protein
MQIAKQLREIIKDGTVSKAIHEVEQDTKRQKKIISMWTSVIKC